MRSVDKMSTCSVAKGQLGLLDTWIPVVRWTQTHCFRRTKSTAHMHAMCPSHILCLLSWTVCSYPTSPLSHGPHSFSPLWAFFLQFPPSHVVNFSSSGVLPMKRWPCTGTFRIRKSLPLHRCSPAYSLRKPFPISLHTDRPHPLPFLPAPPHFRNTHFLVSTPQALPHASQGCRSFIIQASSGKPSQWSSSFTVSPSRL